MSLEITKMSLDFCNAVFQESTEQMLTNVLNYAGNLIPGLANAAIQVTNCTIEPDDGTVMVNVTATTKDKIEWMIEISVCTKDAKKFSILASSDKGLNWHEFTYRSKKGKK